MKKQVAMVQNILEDCEICVFLLTLNFDTKTTTLPYQNLNIIYFLKCGAIQFTVLKIMLPNYV